MKLYKNSNGAIYAYSDEDLENLAKQGINPIEKLSLTYFEYIPNELAEKQAIEAETFLKSKANAMLCKTDRFEHDVYQSKMKDGESNEFDAWRIELLDVALGESSTMPTTPEFMQKFLEL